MPATESFSEDPTLYSSAYDGEAVTPHDTNELTEVSRALYVGSAGNLAVIMKSGAALTFSNVPAGTLLPVRVKQVKATGTGAENIVALY